MVLWREKKEGRITSDFREGLEYGKTSCKKVPVTLISSVI